MLLGIGKKRLRWLTVRFILMTDAGWAATIWLRTPRNLNMPAPILEKPIPAQVINEQAAFGPYDLKTFIKSEDNSKLHFNAMLSTGAALPKGMICTEDGLLTGIPAKGTQGNYELTITVQNDDGSIEVTMGFAIKPSFAGDNNAGYMDKLKTQIWEALEQNLPIPEFAEMYDRPVTISDVYYLLERWGVLTMWDAFHIEPPGEKVILHLEGASEHYNIYDRGNCLVAAPKDLFSHERTLRDGIITVQAMAREVYKRRWTVEMVGFDKLAKAAWVEIQHLGDQYGYQLEVVNYQPNYSEVNLFRKQQNAKYRGGME